MLLVLAAGRTVYLGVLRGGALRKAASNQQLTDETVTAQRGTITDRNGVDLAVSEPAQDISADPYLVTDPLGASQQLAPLLGQTQASVLRKLSERTGFVYLARALPARRAQAVLALKIPGVAGTPVMRRVYPRGTLAAQVLGVVGTEGNGLAGLEYSRNALLQGARANGASSATRSASRCRSPKPARRCPASSLSLTLDANIQQRTEDVLGAVARRFAPKDATAIVMDPRSGAILALANWPQVNANDPGASPAEALEDRAVGFDYEPGSTFKAVTVSGALEAGLITPSTPFNIPDQIQVADRTIHDDTEHAEETLTTSQILARSSNVGAIKIGVLEGAGTLQRLGAPLRLRRAHRRRAAGRGNRRDAAAAAATRAPRWATCRSARASSSRRCRWRPRIRRSPTAGSCARRTSSARSAGARSASRPGTASSRPAPPPRCGRCSRACSRREAPPARSRSPAISSPARRARRARSIRPPANTPTAPTWRRSSASRRPRTRSCCARSSSTNRRSGSIYGGTVAAPAFGQIMSFALPYLGIAPG